MIPRPFHGYKPDALDRVALVTVEQSADRELYLVRVARGPKRRQLRSTTTLGPYGEDEIAGRFAEAVQHLRDEGYWPGGVLALLEAVEQGEPAVRARAALRLGWRREAAAVKDLLAAVPDAVDDVCALLDALGLIGDARAVPVLREYAGRKLLSRRRSAVEAMRQLGDAEGLTEALQRALERLPDDLRSLVTADAAMTNVPAVAQGTLKLEPAAQGLTLDTLYELATPAAVEAARQVLAQVRFDQPFVWRAVKSVLKRSMLRHDHRTFGWLSFAVESRGRMSKGTTAKVKSGYDGQERVTPVFQRKTQDFLRRAAWRYLRDLAAYRPGEYAPAAAEVLLNYTPEHVQQQGAHRCYLLHRVLRGGSKRFRFNGRAMSFRPKHWKQTSPPPGVREEAFPELWDARPSAYVRLLAAARLPEVHVFAAAAVQARHPFVIREAGHADVIAMLDAPFEGTVELALAEIDRRFDPADPDWTLLYKLVTDGRATARTLGQRWLRLTAHLWLPDTDRVIDFLGIPQPNIRALVVELVVGHLRSRPELRQALAGRLVTLLRSPEPMPDAHAGYAAVAQQALADELATLIGTAELANLLATGPEAVKVMAGELLRRRPDAVGELGLEKLAAMARHEIASVRAAAFFLLRSAVAELRKDPSILFVLAESDWADARRVAFELLQERIDLAALGLDGLMGLLDSNRLDVQDAGKALALKHLADLDAAELARRLAEHPHPNVRPFALELAVQYLPQTRESLAKLRHFCRAALFDTWPSRRVKHLVIDFLAARGVEDAAQAEEAVAILGDLVRVQNRDDSERALEALVRVKLAHPEVPATVALLPGGVA